MIQWQDRFCRYETFGTKITLNGVTVTKLWGLKALGTKM
jgi:hypothetical protein